MLEYHLAEQTEQARAQRGRESTQEVKRYFDDAVKVTKKYTATHGHPPAADAAPVPATSAGSGTGRKFNPMAVSGYNAVDASEFLPPNFSLRKDTQENRWILRGELIPNSSHTCTKSYGRNSRITDDASLLILIQLAWQLNKNETGHPCPHNVRSLE
eukprot:761605-Amphidinium_carterae.1